jgi:hypothetical protein
MAFKSKDKILELGPRNKGFKNSEIGFTSAPLRLM